jgi:ribosomal-protein-alanine N-acetyltransferase
MPGLSDSPPGAAGVTIRPLRWWDLEHVLDIERQVFGANAWPAESFWSELARQDRYYVVAEDDSVRGYGGLWIAAADCDVQTVAVDPAVQGRGVGRLLLDHLVQHARELGCRRVHLEVRRDNAPAVRLYESRGFTRVRLRERYYPDLSDALVMGLAL